MDTPEVSGQDVRASVRVCDSRASVCPGKDVV